MVSDEEIIWFKLVGAAIGALTAWQVLAGLLGRG